ncbi:MAG: hypothetical protein QF410_09180, partial [Planctomycetota bacterium]|nr:hypothetical protein [Planctomycetota bacterium]
TVRAPRAALGAAVLCAAGVLAGAQGPPCPNERACNVKARVVEAGTTQNCGFGVIIFGYEISLLGPECPDKKVTYPAHGECHGAPAEGMRCVPAELVPVTYEECDCVTATVLGNGLALPACDCTDGGTIGTLQTYKTEQC